MSDLARRGHQYGEAMEFVELDAFTERDWAEVVAGEHEPFGADGAELEWLDKERHFGLRADDGRLLALAATVRVPVAIDGAGSFEVIGLGGVIVTPAQRGHGLMFRVVQPVLTLAEEMGVEHAMLFCRPPLAAVYARLGFAEVAAPVWAQQAQGPVEMPMRTMWRALRAGAEWPPGRVELRGLPF
jgi:predicted GNAT family N-acyltransferase